MRAMRGLVTALVVLGSGSLSSCTSTARVTDLYMALDGGGDRQRTVFYTDTKEIHCIVEVAVSRHDVTLELLVRQLQAYDFAGEKFFDTNRVTANVEGAPTAGSGPQKLDVRVNPQAADGTDATDGPFMPGHFQCEAYLDGDLEKTAVFNIDFADCPSSTIPQGSVCLGFYRPSTQCKKYGLTSKDPAQCRCDAAKGWQCDP